LSLRVSGRSFQEIGDALGVSKPVAWKIVDKALQEFRQAHMADADQVRAVAMARLEALVRHAWAKVEQGDMDAVRTVLLVTARLCKMMGLDAPSTYKVTAPAGGARRLDQMSEAELVERARILGLLPKSPPTWEAK
jgi:hypothetical protein